MSRVEIQVRPKPRRRNPCTSAEGWVVKQEQSDNIQMFGATVRTPQEAKQAATEFAKSIRQEVPV